MASMNFSPYGEHRNSSHWFFPSICYYIFTTLVWCTNFFKLKGLRVDRTIGSVLTHNGLWSDHLPSRWWTLADRNQSNHSGVATTLSSLSHVMSPTLLFVQVNLGPVNSRSTKPQSSRTSRNICIWRSDLLWRPCFSSSPLICWNPPCSIMVTYFESWDVEARSMILHDYGLLGLHRSL